MSQCNEMLKAEGKSYPRTCQKCRLGPCTYKPTEEERSLVSKSQFLMKVTGDLQSLPFRDMLTLSRQLQVSLPSKPTKDLSVAEIAEALLSAAEHVNPTKAGNFIPQFPINGRD